MTTLRKLADGRGRELLNACQAVAYLQILGSNNWQLCADSACLQFTQRGQTMPQSLEIAHAAVGIAEQLEHHPVIEISYRQLFLSITTDDSDGLTAYDFAFAAQLQLWLVAQSKFKP